MIYDVMTGKAYDSNDNVVGEFFSVEEAEAKYPGITLVVYHQVTR